MGLSIGFRRSSEGCSEGIFYGLRINDDEFYLDKLNTQNMGHGSDHWTESFFVANRDKNFNPIDIHKWINEVEAILNFEDEIQLSASRDHV